MTSGQSLRGVLCRQGGRREFNGATFAVEIIGSTIDLNNSEISQKLLGELVPIVYRALKATG
jgi:hypothetical protein